MPSGGARPRSGPAKDPDALRRDRPSDKAAWITLPATRTDPAPDWPLPSPASDEEQLIWESEWTRPQAYQWEKLNLEMSVALYVRRLVEAQTPGSKPNVGTLVRQMQDELGISISGMLKHGWTISVQPDEAPLTVPRAPRTVKNSARDRFKIVPSVAEDEPTSDD